MATDPRCENCQRSHNFQAFEKVGETMRWYCSEVCKEEFHSDKLSQREFGYGGWQ